MVDDHVCGHFFDDIEFAFGEFGGVGGDMFYRSINKKTQDVKYRPILV
jgi:hypothetical protein